MLATLSPCDGPQGPGPFRAPALHGEGVLMTDTTTRDERVAESVRRALALVGPAESGVERADDGRADLS